MTNPRDCLHHVLLALALSLAPTLARADAIDDLAPGTWYEIPDTPMRAVCPPDTAQYEWSYYCNNAILAWGGGAMDTTRGRLVVWGGGHGDYWGNEVYVFDLHALSWTRPWGPTPDAQIPSGGTHEVYDDGNPGSRHTYSGLVYVPAPHDAMISMGGALWQSGFFAAGVWSFSFGDNAWTRLGDGPSAGEGYGDPLVFDPVTGHVFRRSNQRMLEYDPVADTFTDRWQSDGGFWTSNVAAALDPDARLMIIVGDGRLDTYDIDTDTYVIDVPIEGGDVESVLGGGSPGVAFDGERFVMWGGGLELYTYDPVASTFAMHEMAGDDPGTISASGGAFGRFRYAPTRNVFVWVDNADKNVFVARMSEGTGVPPGDDTTGGESGGSEGGADTSTGGSGGSSATTSATGPDPTGTDPTTTTTTTADETTGGAASDEESGGCGCKTSAPGTLASWLLLPLLWRRRR